MRLNKKLLLNGYALPLVVGSDLVCMGFNQATSAKFEIQTTEPLPHRCTVEFFAGIASDVQQHLMVCGLLTSVRRSPTGWQLEVHESSERLEQPVRIDLSACTGRDVLATLQRRMGLQFLSPKQEKRMNLALPAFCFEGSANQVLLHLGKALGIRGAIWQQLSDGRVFWGAWNKAPFNAHPLNMDPRLIKHWDPRKGVMQLHYIPALKPGVVLQGPWGLLRVDALVFNDAEVHAQCTAVSSQALHAS